MKISFIIETILNVILIIALGFVPVMLYETTTANFIFSIFVCVLFGVAIIYMMVSDIIQERNDQKNTKGLKNASQSF